MQRALFTAIDSNFHSKFHLNEILKMIVSYYIIHTNYFGRPGIEATMCKIYNFSVVTSICPKYHYTHLSYVKTSCEKN